MADEEQLQQVPESEAPSIAPDEGSRNDGRQERRSLREELENSFNEARQDQDREEKRDEHGRFLKGNKPPPRQRPPEGTQAAPETADHTAPEAPLDTVAPEADKPTTQPPTGWPKEAKAEWNVLSPTIQQAVLKREQDTQKGVDELKAKYSDIDRALEPHIQAIRNHGHSPAQAVKQLFDWFQALAQNPKEAFPALAKSFNYDLNQTAGSPSPAGAQPAQTGEPTQDASQATEEVPLRVKQEMEALRKEVTTLASSWREQTEAQTHQALNQWAKDKEHFSEVRGDMAQLIQSGVIPLKDGRVDLDTAYDRAIWANPDIRMKLMAKQQADFEAKQEALLERKQKAQQEAANKARRAATSIAPRAPSADAGKSAKKAGKSVRESLRDAMEELSP